MEAINLDDLARDVIRILVGLTLLVALALQGCQDHPGKVAVVGLEHRLNASPDFSEREHQEFLAALNEERVRKEAVERTHDDMRPAGEWVCIKWRRPDGSTIDATAMSDSAIKHHRHYATQEQVGKDALVCHVWKCDLGLGKSFATDSKKACPAPKPSS